MPLEWYEYEGPEEYGRIEAHMGVYVNESGTLGDIATCEEYQRSEVLAHDNLHWCSINSCDNRPG